MSNTLYKRGDVVWIDFAGEPTKAKIKIVFFDGTFLCKTWFPWMTVYSAGRRIYGHSRSFFSRLFNKD